MNPFEKDWAKPSPVEVDVAGPGAVVLDVDKAKQPIKAEKANDTIGAVGKTTAIVFSFDTTGSMAPCIGQVRKHLREVTSQMNKDLPGLKIGLIAHGDYCDGAACIDVLDLTSDIEAVMKFINNAPNTGGGDLPECYELALSRARNMSWPKEGGSLILIGDDEPHDVNYDLNTGHLDYHKELAALVESGIRVFPMQCLKKDNRQTVNNFWESVAKISKTPLLVLESFNDSTGTLESVAYASAGAEVYRGYKEKKTGGSMSWLNDATGGAITAASPNLAENRSKLEEFTEGKE